MNAIVKLKTALGIKADAAEIMIVNKSLNGNSECKSMSDGRVLNVSGRYSVGTKLIVKNGVVQSVVKDSGLVVFE